MVYNILSCGGFETGAGWVAGGGCLSSRLGLVFLFFLVAVIRKWGAEEMGIDFSFFVGIAGKQFI